MKENAMEPEQPTLVDNSLSLDTELNTLLELAAALDQATTVIRSKFCPPEPTVAAPAPPTENPFYFGTIHSIREMLRASLANAEDVCKRL